VRKLDLNRREQLLALALTHQRGPSDSAAAERRQAVRAANETIYNQIEPHRERLQQPDMSCCFLCECGRSGCLEPLLLSLDHYQSLRTTLRFGAPRSVLAHEVVLCRRCGETRAPTSAEWWS
jgi:hypothetical protein